LQLLNVRHTFFRAGKILTGESLHPVEDMCVEIKNGIVTRIEPARDINLTRKPLDLSPLTLVPGPVDCHVHLALDGRDFRGCLEKWRSQREINLHIGEQLKTTLDCGITSVRDGGDRSGLVLAFKTSEKPKPYIRASGAALRLQGMYGSFLGPGLKQHQVREAVSFMARKGADQVKVLVSGVVSFKEYGRVGPVQFNLATLEKIVQTARYHGLKVMAHASSDQAVRNCVLAGVDSVEHGYFLTRDTLNMMAEKGIYWIPTVVPVANQLKEPRSETLSPLEQKVIEKTYRRHLDMISLALELGVPVAVGTDAGAAGVLHGKGFHEELQLYAGAGLSPPEILKAATVEGSKLLGLNSGLEVGKPARFIAVEGDPLEDLRVLEKPKYVAL